jgi:hypothetical protein
LQVESNEVATPIGSEDRTLETEAGEVSWKESAAYLPKSRKFFEDYRVRPASSLIGRLADLIH